MKEIKMPSMSPTMESGKIVKWIKNEGEEVRIGDVIAEIETDKASMEYESEYKGRVGKIIKREGEEVKVGEIIGIMLEEGENEKEIEGYKIKEIEEEDKKDNISSSRDDFIYISNNKNLRDSDRIFISPLAKVIAKQNNVDIYKVKGTGPNNRIIKSDILYYLNHLSNIKSATNKLDVSSQSPDYIDIQNSSMRKTIAKRLLDAKTSIPHYYLNVDCIVDDLLKARVNINLQGKDKYKISINDFIIKAVGLAMRDVPEANSYWQGETSRQFSRQDVSVAVAIPNGLITPIIRDAANKGLITISNEMKSLAKKAKEGSLKPEEFQGGGFSVSNLGMYGVDSFAAIINPPQSGILAVGSVRQMPIVDNRNIIIGNVLSLVLSADHRTMDGAIGATFLVKVKHYLENPTSMLL